MERGTDDLPVVETTRPSQRNPVSLHADEIPAAGLAPPAEKPWMPERAREGMRSRIAGYLIALLTAVIMAGWISTWQGTPAEQVTDMLQSTLNPLIGLVGAATGFYFGGRAS